VTGRRGRRRRKLLDDLKERTGYCHLKKEALDRTMWRAALEGALDRSQDRLPNELPSDEELCHQFLPCCSQNLLLVLTS
jgi:hypothetical protein